MASLARSRVGGSALALSLPGGYNLALVQDIMEDDQRYQAALDYLYSYVDYSLTRGFQFAPDKFDLGRMRELLDRLGAPDRGYPILHVAGTKGKGSVSALCASVLQSSGYRVGLYTSPHLQDYCERIQVNGEPIPHEAFIELVDEVKPHVAAIESLTTFEITTALGFLWFARNRVEVTVVEVGLGGRLDATNVIDPLVSVITALSYDHMNVLGDTLAQIATEKAGIIKPGKPVVSAPQKPEALEVLEKTARERNSPLCLVGRDMLFGPVSHSLDGQTLFVWEAKDQEKVNDFIEGCGEPGWKPLHLNIPLLGFHQVENAATAYAALQVAREQGLAMKPEAVLEGMRKVRWPARFEVLRRDPPVVIDSAHNADSAQKLRITLDDYFPGLQVILIFGVSEDKDVPGILSALLPRVSKVIATQSIHPRAMNAEKIVSLVHQFGLPARAVTPVEAALGAGLEEAGDRCVLLATGSLFIAAGVHWAWQERFPESHPGTKA